MKVRLFIILLFVGCTSFFASAQNKYDQRIYDCINQNRWFELADQYKQYKDSLGDFVRLLASGTLNTYTYRMDEAIFSLSELLDKYDSLLGEASIAYVKQLTDCYVEVGQFQKADTLFTSLISSLSDAGWTADDLLSFYQFRDFLRCFSSYPKIEISGLNDLIIPIDTIDGLIFFDMKIGNEHRKTLFDTGCTQTIAFVPIPEKHLLSSPYLVSSNLGEEVKAYMACVDLMQIGGMSVRNLPVTYMPQSPIPDSLKTKIPHFDMALGMDVIKRMGCFTIDLEKMELVVHPNDSLQCSTRPNMLIVNEHLWVETKFPNKILALVYDSGYGGRNGVSLRNKLNPSDVGVKIVSKLGVGIGIIDNPAVEYHYPNVFQVGNVSIDMAAYYIEDWLDIWSGNPEGVFGSILAKHCRTITFDFENMNIKCTK